MCNSFLSPWMSELPCTWSGYLRRVTTVPRYCLGFESQEMSIKIMHKRQWLGNSTPLLESRNKTPLGNRTRDRYEWIIWEPVIIPGRGHVVFGGLCGGLTPSSGLCDPPHCMENKSSASSSLRSTLQWRLEIGEWRMHKNKYKLFSGAQWLKLYSSSWYILLYCLHP